MNLGIDTSEYGKLAFSLMEKGNPISHKATSDGRYKNNIKLAEKSFAVKPHESSEILDDLDKFLKANKIQDPKSMLKNIVVYKGQGSFTGLRIAAAVAEALSLAWGIPTKFTNKK